MTQWLQRASLLQAFRAAVSAALIVTVLTSAASCRNRHDPVSPQPGKTVRGMWTVLGGEDSAPLDSTKLVTVLGPDSAKFFRTDIRLRFKSGVSDSAKQAFFAREGMTVFGYRAIIDEFEVRIPDPGTRMDQYLAALDRLRALPEVDEVISRSATPMRPVRHGRYPTDGQGVVRAEWIDQANAWTQPLRDIRAPLAWGCETGTYGGTVPRVAVLEHKHPQGHPEFTASTPYLWQPPTSTPGLLWVHPDSVLAAVAHATAVTGMLTARGNNGGGVAGVTSRTQLDQFALYSSANHRLEISSPHFSEVLNAIAQRQPRILNITVDETFDAGTAASVQLAAIRTIERAVRTLLLDAVPNLTIVVAAGNDGWYGSVSDFAQKDQASLLLAALLRLRQQTTYQDRIIVVGGTKSNNVWYSITSSNGSRYFDGAVDIAAPSYMVLALERRTTEPLASVPYAQMSGTSYGAPMVSGVAAQLLTMRPTLSPKEVKDYIRDGAKEKRQHPTTGIELIPTPVQGMPKPDEEVYQLDAYGSLSKLSRETHGTPICGVGVRGGPANRLVIDREGPDEVIAPGDGQVVYEGQLPSVAQGGRQLALSMPHRSVDQGMGTYTYKLQSSGWAVDSVIGPMMIQYLEQDTAFVTLELRSTPPDVYLYQLDMKVRITSADASRAVGEITVTSGLPLANSVGWLSWSAAPVSPTGDWVVFDFYQYDTDYCASLGDIYKNTVYAMPLRGTGGLRTLKGATFDTQCQGLPYPDGWDEGGIEVWKDDGTAFVRASSVIHGSTWGTDLQRFMYPTVTTNFIGSTPTTVPGESARALSWDAEGGAVRYKYSATSTWACVLETRQASALSTLISTASCDPPTSPQAPSNLLASQRQTSRRYAGGLFHPNDAETRRALVQEIAAHRRNKVPRVSGFR
jgi:hypothetical protein